MAFTATAFKSVLRSAVVAIALGASSLVAAPAFAQSVTSGFSLEIFGNGDAQGYSGRQRLDRHNGWDDGYRMRCLTNREVARGIRAYGYDQVEIMRSFRGDRLEVQAVKGRWLYSMRVDKCTGQVDRMERIGRAFGGGYRGHVDNDGISNPGFSFEFSFGN